jgi:hypothetical protein
LSSIIPLAETAPKDDSPNPKLPLTSCPEPSDLDDELELRPQRPRQPANHGPKGKSNDLHRSADEGPERVVSAISSFHGTSKPVHKESEPEYGEARARGKATPEMLVIPERTGRPSSGTERAGGEGGGGVRGRKRKVALAVESDLRGPLEARILVASVDEEDASGSRVRKRSKAAPREDTAGCGQGGIGEDGEGVGSDARQMKAKQRDEAKPASKKRPREADAGAEAEVAAKRPPAKASSTAAQKRAKVVVDGQPGRAKGRSAPGLKDGVLARPRSRNLGENTAAAAQRGKSRQGGRGAGLKVRVFVGLLERMLRLVYLLFYFLNVSSRQYGKVPRVFFRSELIHHWSTTTNRILSISYRECTYYISHTSMLYMALYLLYPYRWNILA